MTTLTVTETRVCIQLNDRTVFARLSALPEDGMSIRIGFDDEEDGDGWWYSEQDIRALRKALGDMLALRKQISQ